MTTAAAKQPASFGALFRDHSFHSFLWAQVLGAFNDNVYKMIVAVFAVAAASDAAQRGWYLGLSNAIFVLPFLLFAGYAGQLADRYSKTRVLQVTKAFEIVTMLVGIGALVSGHIGGLFVVLFLLAMQANFFSPAKYGILPELLGTEQLSRANGLLELSTFVAIVVGTSFGTFLFEHLKGQPVVMGSILLAIAIVGFVTSLGIRKTEPARASEPFHWNPIAEVVRGTRSLLQHRDMTLTVTGISWFWFIGALFQMCLLLMGTEVLHVSETKVGLLVTALAIGIGAGSVAAGKLSGDFIELGLVPVGSILLGIGTIALGCTHNYNAAAVILVAIGFAGGLFIVPLNAYLQDKADPAEKGRVLATNNVMNTLGVISASGVIWLLHGLLHWSASATLIALGIVTITATSYIVWILPDFTIRFVMRCAAHCCFRIHINGAENMPKEGGALIAANHVSFADAVLLGCTTDRMIRFLMWQPIYETRGLKWFFRLMHAAPLPVDSPKNTLRALRTAREQLIGGELVGIFPEGALTQTGQVLPFQRGFERISDGTDAPIVPVYLDGLYGHPLSRKGGKLFNCWERWWRPRVVIEIGEPVYGEVSPGELRERVLQLSTKAAASRQDASDTLVHRFVANARAQWSDPAVADSTGKNLTFGRTLAGALLLRRWLDCNCDGQQYIGLLLPPSVAGAIANVAVALAGKTAVNLNFTVGVEAMNAAEKRCELKTILTSRAFLAKTKIERTEKMICMEDVMDEFTPFTKAIAFAQARLAPQRMLTSPVTPDTVAAIIFSSGSTGDPKGVELTHWNLVSNIDAVADVYQVGRTDCMLGALPFFHSFGFTYTLWFPLVKGFRAVFHPNPIDGKTIGRLAAENKATFLLSTPTFCNAYIRQCTREQFATLRYVLVGAEKLRPALAERFAEQFGITMFEGYGCTEMGPVVAVNTKDATLEKPVQKGNQPGSVGRPIPGVSVRIVDPETYEEQPTGSTGLLLVNGPSRMRGYVKDSERTGASMRDGYYVTGDIARIDDGGFLHILDRLARMSKIGGEMVPHIKIEQELASMSVDSTYLVVGIPDEARGERLVVLYTDPVVTPEQIVSHLNKATLPALWIPKRDNCYRIDAIPTLGTGKVDLRRAKLLAQEAADERTPAQVSA